MGVDVYDGSDGSSYSFNISFNVSDGVTWEIVRSKDGRYDVITPEGKQYSGVTSDGNCIKDGEVCYIPGFSDVLEKVLGRKKMVIMHNKIRGLLNEALGGFNIRTIKVKGKEYIYSTLQDLGCQLNEDDVSPKEIWTKSKEKYPDLTRNAFSKIAFETWDYEGFRLWKNLAEQLKKDGASPKEIWTKCEEIYPNLKREEFLPVALELGFSGMDLKSLQDDVVGPEENDSQPW